MVPAHDNSGSAGHKSKQFERENKFWGEALSQLIDGAARKIYSGTQVIRGPCFLDA